MSTQLRPVRTDLPPPVRNLLHDERPVGWLAGNRLGFFGFGDAREAANAAWVAYRTVSRKLAPVLGVRPTPIDIEPLSIAWQPNGEVILASGRPVATLLRPGADSPSGSQWFGFEIEVAPAVDERLLREAMRSASRALLKSGVQWAMVRPKSRLRSCLPRQATISPRSMRLPRQWRQRAS